MKTETLQHKYDAAVEVNKKLNEIIAEMRESSESNGFFNDQNAEYWYFKYINEWEKAEPEQSTPKSEEHPMEIGYTCSDCGKKWRSNNPHTHCPKCSDEQSEEVQQVDITDKINSLSLKNREAIELIVNNLYLLENCNR